jgi:hypothetical protein
MSRVDSHIFTMNNPMPESTLTLNKSESTLSPVRDLGFGLWMEGRIQPWDGNGSRVEGRRERGLIENGGMELHGEW